MSNLYALDAIKEKDQHISILDEQLKKQEIEEIETSKQIIDNLQ